MIERPDDREILASVAATLRSEVYPELHPGWARSTVAQLVALCELALQRGTDPEPQHRAELAAALDDLIANPIVIESIRPEMSSWEQAAAVLATAAPRTDRAAIEVQRRLRPLLVRQLDDELATAAAMLAGFRGRLPPMNGSDV